MVDPTPLARIAALIPDRVEQHYGPDRRVDGLRAACRAFSGRAETVHAGNLAELQSAAQVVFRHLELSLDNLDPEERSPGWPPADLAAARRSGAGVSAVRRQADGTAVIELTELAPVAAAAPILRGVFALVQHADRVVLDLRRNGGGDPATVAFIVDWLAAGGSPRHLFDVRYRDHTRQWWTSGVPVAPPPAGSVQALIGSDTYSSGEALAWALQQQRLARLIGTPTRGAADHVVPLALTHDVRALIPEAAVVTADGGPTWEGDGVQPDEPGDATSPVS